MGGNALKQYETKRLDREDYFKLVAKVQAELTKLGIESSVIAAYHNKETFGDADILVVSESLPPNWVDEIKRVFSLTEDQYVKNGSVLSIGVDNFQVDLIVTPEKELHASIVYFSFNDLGNLIGRIGHKLGIKIGHSGVSIVVRPVGRTDHIIEEIMLTDDLFEAFDVLGLDVDQFIDGFDDLEDIFKYVASSKYFDPEIYSLEHRSYASRVRDRKRQTYNKFLRWVEETKPPAHHSFGVKSELGGYSLRMPYYEDVVLKHWPHAKPLVDAAIAKHEFNQQFKSVYNGEIVSALTRFVGRDLGEFMAAHRSHITDDIKREWIANPALVEPAILKFLDEFEDDDE